MYHFTCTVTAQVVVAVAMVVAALAGAAATVARRPVVPVALAEVAAVHVEAGPQRTVWTIPSSRMRQ